MAFLDSGVQSQTQDQAAQGQAAGGTPNAPNVSGAGGSDVGGVSTAGIGQGGTGGWTNIQAYLNANQGDQGSANNLKESVGGQFGKEQGQMQDAADKTIKDAGDYVTNSNISKDQANDLIGQAAKAYSYAGPDGTKGGFASNPDQFAQKGSFLTNTPGAPVNYYQKATPPPAQPTDTFQQQGLGDQPTYKGIVDRFHSALNDQWGMPTSFAPGLSAQSQNYGEQVNNDNGFQNLMSKLYSDKAGTPLTSGQQALQNQFDSGNQALAKTRQDLQGQYQGLQKNASDLGQIVTNTLNTDQSQYLANQANLKDYLGQQSGQYDQSINKAQEDARNAYQGEYNTGSGRSFAADSGPMRAQYGLPVDGFHNQFVNGDYLDQLGDHSGNMTWAQLQHEGDLGTGSGPLAGVYGGKAGVNSGWMYNNNQPVLDELHNQFTGNQGALQDFYGNEDSKYANTADPDKRAFNSIQDFLGLQGNQKQQGFNVRG